MIDVGNDCHWYGMGGSVLKDGETEEEHDHGEIQVG